MAHKSWKRALSAAVLVVGALAATGISATVGWRPFIGPRARPLTGRTFDPTPARLARGEYLATAVAGCLYCHSELAIGEPGAGITYRQGYEGSGRSFTGEGLPFLHSPNLTPHPNAGTGRWTDDMLARAVREGVGHDGRALFPMMPYANYRRMSDEDLASIVAYLRSLRPLATGQPKPEIPFPVNRLINSAPQPIVEPVPEPDLSTPPARGEYITTLAGCADCHTPMNERGEYLLHLPFGGGQPITIEGVRPMAASANLTPSTSGIPYYTEDLFLEAMRTGRVRERQLSDLMPWAFYKKMTDEDLRAIFAYLRTLKPVEHYVDNSMAATACALCGLTHGGGERNRK